MKANATALFMLCAIHAGCVSSYMTSYDEPQPPANPEIEIPSSKSTMTAEELVEEMGEPTRIITVNEEENTYVYYYSKAVWFSSKPVWKSPPLISALWERSEAEYYIRDGIVEKVVY